VRPGQWGADSPAAIRQPSAIKHGQVVLGRLQGAECRYVRHLPAGTSVFGTKERQVKVRVVCGDCGAGQTLVQVRDHVSEHWCVRHVRVGDPVNMGCSDRALRVEAGRPLVQHPTPRVRGDDRDLDHPMGLSGQAGRLNIDDREVRLPWRVRGSDLRPRCRRYCVIAPATELV
jgi:hypothetical protein